MDTGSQHQDALELKGDWVVQGMKKSDKFFRADKIDLKSLDKQLERHMSRAWSMQQREARQSKEEWEIDPTKLAINSPIGRGTYGTVHRGVYDGKVVAGIPSPFNAKLHQLAVQLAVILFVGCRLSFQLGQHSKNACLLLFEEVISTESFENWTLLGFLFSLFNYMSSAPNPWLTT